MVLTETPPRSDVCQLPICLSAPGAARRPLPAGRVQPTFVSLPGGASILNLLTVSAQRGRRLQNLAYCQVFQTFLLTVLHGEASMID